ncbi:GDP-L-fucose synthase [Algoriphagus sp. 4150]|uniref:GDP-L-fucose synthase family protein n=1 Tax=Algoriphagus sp. 4150 TaxID=2817756 RepID=UPI002866D7AC|nr:GDP-L-fucose synthase [Algoriphagus sp. 4150]MDR7131781.1 GDP-L-fucose synthase [Algoriphagus sp. 4150]
MDFLKKKIYVAGHSGMVGSAIWRLLQARGAEHLIGMSSRDLDLRDQYAVSEFFKEEKPDIVIDAAAKVGGILANDSYPYEFLVENLQIQNNLISSALKGNVERFLFLGSSCVYPKKAPQPIKEEYLLTGPLEATNESYAIAKIAGIKACEAIFRKKNRMFTSIMPSNLYGAFDNFDLNSSHVLPAMIRKFHESKINGNQPVKLWGTGSPLREFLYVDDLADAVIFLLNKNAPYPVLNVGTGYDIEIKSLALRIQNVVGHEGEIFWDVDKPDGTHRKVMDISKMRGMGWEPRVSLIEGITKTYNWYLQNISNLKMVDMHI